jgi:hypothetical protein
MHCRCVLLYTKLVTFKREREGERLREREIKREREREGERMMMIRDDCDCIHCMHFRCVLLYTKLVTFIILYLYCIAAYDENDSSHIVKQCDFDESLQQKGCVTLSVKDSGAGMSEDHLKVSH